MKENKNLEDKKKKFILDLKLLEIESVKYMIKNYLRVRLIKVLKYINSYNAYFFYSCYFERSKNIAIAFLN